MDYTDQCSFYGDSLSKVQGSPSPCFDPKQEGENAENDKFEGDKLRKEVPYFPDELYDRLPEFLTRGLKLVRNKRERDILLLAMITNISGCLPGVRMNYGRLISAAEPHMIFSFSSACVRCWRRCP